MSRSKSVGEPVESIGPPRMFRDTVFTSRTLVLPDGNTALVDKGQVAAFGDKQFAYFSSHPELELMQE